MMCHAFEVFEVLHVLNKTGFKKAKKKCIFLLSFLSLISLFKLFFFLGTTFFSLISVRALRYIINPAGSSVYILTTVSLIVDVNFRWSPLPK